MCMSTRPKAKDGPMQAPLPWVALESGSQAPIHFSLYGWTLFGQPAILIYHQFSFLLNC